MIPREAPDRCCDMIMKGGITSGIVYPLAVVEIAKVFRLQSVGGASAGAIAAAAAAAAERGRARGGFEELGRLPQWLGEPSPGAKGSNLFNLFQPQAATRALFAIVTAPLRARRFKRLALLGEAIRQFGWWALLGAVPGALVLADGARRPPGGGPVLEMAAGAALSLIGLLLAVAITLMVTSGRALVRNLYGLCTGRGDGHRGAETALSDWLTAYLDRLAGKPADGPPLTFGELWWPGLPAGGRGDPDEQAIRLEMMTTCLSHGRPYRLPFRDSDDVRENRLFWFRPAEFRRIFPERVVRWMEEHPRAVADAGDGPGRGLVPLPEPWNLPVVVATRMSLSFPLLLSMVPLDAVDYSRDGAEAKPEPCWFSDGGLCSNFPVHFFDAPLPRWPTFAIDLRDATPGRKPGVWMVETNSEGILESWSRFPAGSSARNLLRFAGMAARTMQNWNDAMAARLPGQRDRIAHVTLAADEGGLNLDMPAARIAALAERGRRAGAELVRRFAAPQPDVEMNWSNHRWIRLRTTLAALDEMLGRIEAACAHPQAGDPGYDDWIRSSDPPPSYPWDSQEQQDLAARTLADLRGAARRLIRSGASLAPRAPRPRPELRPRPRT